MNNNTMVKRINLEDLLTQLDSDNAKAFVIERIFQFSRNDTVTVRKIKERFEITDKLLDSSIEFFEKEGDYFHAGILCLKRKSTERAINNFIQGKLYYWAGTTAKEAGMFEKSYEYYLTEYKSEAAKKRAYPSYYSLREVAEKIGKKKELIDIFEEFLDYFNAAYLAEEEGLFERAVEDFIRANNFESAMKTAIKRGMAETVIEKYEKRKEYWAALHLAMANNRWEIANKNCDLWLTEHVDKELSIDQKLQKVYLQAVKCYFNLELYQYIKPVAEKVTEIDKGLIALFLEPQERFSNAVSQGLERDSIEEIIKQYLEIKKIENTLNSCDDEAEKRMLGLEIVKLYEGMDQFEDITILLEKIGVIDTDIVREVSWDYEFGLESIHYKKGWFGHAAKILEDLGMFERAVEDYAKAGDLLYAKKLVQKHSLDVSKLNQLLLTLIQHYEKIEDFQYAIKLVYDLDLPKGFQEERVQQLYSKLINHYEERGNLEEAASIANYHARMHQKAVELYLKSDDFRQAGFAAESAGMFRDSITHFERAGDFWSALRVARKQNFSIKIPELVPKVINQFRTKSDLVMLANTYEEERMYDDAIKTFEEIKLYNRAGYAAETAGLVDKALAFYEKGSSYDDFENVARLAKQTGNIQKIKLYHQIIGIFEELKRPIQNQKPKRLRQ